MTNNLEIGKLPNEILQNLVLDKIKSLRPEVLVGSSLGEDTAVLDFKEDLIVLSCDPITGTDSNLGKLGVHISVNDISTSAAEPVGILLTLLLPSNSKEEDVSIIMEEVGRETKKLNMDIIGGHTEITAAVNKPVIISTVIGRVKKDHLPKRKDVGPGYLVALSKTAGLEGTAIIAYDKKHELKDQISNKEFEEALEQFNNISVLKEGLCSRKYNIGYMHDVTESGIEGALWEASEALGYGMEIEKNSIPVLKSTKSICNYFNIDPYKLISSGSMLVIIDKNHFEAYKDDLKKEGIQLTRIGELIAERTLTYSDQGIRTLIDRPGTDELYKVL